MDSSALRIVAVIALMGVAGALSVATAPAGNDAGYLWPAGLATAALLWARRSQAPYVALAVFVVAALTFIPGDYSLQVGLAFAAAIAVEAYVVDRLIPRGEDGWPWLLRTRDVGLYTRACIVGALLGTAGFTLTAVLAGHGMPWEVAAAVLSRHLASQLIVVPLFLRVPAMLFSPPWSERAVRLGLTLGAAVLVLGPLSLPGLTFLLLPLLGWSSVRAPLRENQVLVAAVAAITAVFADAGWGPFHELATELGLPVAVQQVPMNTFLIACCLVCVPFAVSARAHREALREVAAERTRSDRLLHSAQGLVIIGADDLGRINLFNQGAERILGYSAEEVLGKSMEMLHSREEIVRLAATFGCRSTYHDVITAFMGRELLTPMDWEFVRKDGERRILSYLLTPLHTHGQLTGLLASADDMTDRVRTQEQLERALVRALAAESDAISKLEQVDRAKDSFVSAISHELRTPITNLMGYLELLQDGSYGAMSPEQDQALSRIDLNSRRLLSLIDDLLTLARIEEQHEVPLQEMVDLVALAQTEANELRDLCDARDLRVQLIVPDRPVHVRGDAGQLARLIANLADNAAKFTPAGGTITIRVRREAVTARLEVADTGVGIPAMEQDRVFNRFFRTTTAEADAIPGTGLGLFIARAIVDAHGADISFDSSPRGTTFTVRLPLAAV